MSSNFFSFLYTILWRLARPFLRKHKRLHEGFEQRLVPSNWAEKADVWIQSASGGEAYLVRTLLERFPEQSTPLKVLLTTWTQQGQVVLEETKNRLIDNRQDIQIQIQFFPLDEPILMEKALEQVQPKVVVLLETEFWPGLLLACKKKDIPILVLNGRITARSLRGYDWISWFFPEFWRLVAPRYVAAISSADAARFSALFEEHSVGLVPNIKFDRTILEVLSLEKLEKSLSILLCNKALIVLASIREEEETLLIPVIRRLYIRWKEKARIVIVPRHMHRVKVWVEKLRSAKIPFQKRSSLINLTPEEEKRQKVHSLAVILWDSFGELEQLYSLAQAIFVGGSLAPLGGQNFLEPLSRGKIPCVGQYLDNFSWVFEPLFAEEEDVSLTSLSLVKICSSTKELEEQLEYQLNYPQSTEEVLSRFMMWLKPRRGGVDKSISLLMTLLE